MSSNRRSSLTSESGSSVLEIASRTGEDEDDPLPFLGNKITSFFDWVWRGQSESESDDDLPEPEPGTLQKLLVKLYEVLRKLRVLITKLPKIR